MTYLTRATLNRHAPEHALRPLLDPLDPDTAFDAHHRLIWTLFSNRCASRNFLWRADGYGKFFILSSRQPQESRLFRPLESKRFSPVLSVGDQLIFVLRANATKDRRSNLQDEIVSGTQRKPRHSRRVDIVMHAMQELGLNRKASGEGTRAAQRLEIADMVARSWLTGQGKIRGFSLDKSMVDSYQVRKLKRSGGKDATFGIVDIKGLLTVRDPAAFTKALQMGFGRAKSYGCGLMLIRRA